jgi:GT2 family glycosyltransferase
MHIPHVLYHDAIITPRLPITLSLPENLPIISIIIPTRDRWDLLGPCLESIKCTDWPTERIEIIVVDNGSTDLMCLKMLEKATEERLIRVIRDDSQFNWSRLNNIAALKSRGSLLLFLNNDTEVLDKEWLKKLAIHALQPGTGAVGCKLLYPDRSVQHGGLIAGIQGVASHAHLHLQAYEGGYHNLAITTHEVLAVTGACLAVTRENFEAVGGFNEHLPIVFNDTLFCLDLHMLGKRNVYVAEPLLIHYESKSRGYDDSPEKLANFQSEALKVWRLHSKLMQTDPFYSPNLSLWSPYKLSLAPRRRAIWDDRHLCAPRIMMFSITHAIGHDIAVVMAQQAKALVQCGYEVIIAGPRSNNDVPYPGCDRIELNNPLSAIKVVTGRSVDLVIVETPPFFSISRWTGGHPPVLAIDHGDLSSEWFPDAERRRSELAEKKQALMMATAVLAISDAVAAESQVPIHGILANRNSHLGRWNNESNDRRAFSRKRQGWDDHFVVLNVCRFHEVDLDYNGIDAYINVIDALQTAEPELYKRTIFVLCSKGFPKDVDSMSSHGLVIAANITDEELTDLYCAADAYANFSKWEGYNFGIRQALAMGLPVVASNIPVHRMFGIDVTNCALETVAWLVQKAAPNRSRTPQLWNWDEQLSSFIHMVDSICGK